MKAKADFHIHTHNSPDGSSSASEIIDEARRKGLDVIGVTDHNTTKGAIEVKNLAKGRPLVLVGQEVMTDGGEVIVFGMERDLAKGMGVADTCRMAKAAGGFVVVPHPFDMSRNGVGNDMQGLLDYIDAIEVLNARCLRNGFNRKALDFAREHEIPVVSGSDAHFPSEIGGCFTELEIEGKLTQESVFGAISSGRTSVSGAKSGVVPHLRTMLLKMKRKLGISR